MSIDQDTIKHVAHLARIELEEQELKRLAGELYAILNFIDKLKQLDVEQVKPSSHILPISNVLREDNPGVSLPCQTVLENAPAKKGNFFTVPKIIE